MLRVILGSSPIFTSAFLNQSIQSPYPAVPGAEDAPIETSVSAPLGDPDR